ncbi:hypothetical protein PVAND_003274 [Polypedilum vanderplanki]|uniref:Secreted protein n=1 Tax=Polypedilum vanderplanki TaxID=319348 RepID=A0A9J6BU23_POLVA|nr:hypothetical protein PVAND_003274 [Polypedilum vanderplanki]
MKFLIILIYIFVLFDGFSTAKNSSSENKSEVALTSNERRQHFHDVSNREADEVLELLAQTPKPEDFLTMLRRIMNNYGEINLKVDEIMKEVPSHNDFSHEKIHST